MKKKIEKKEEDHAFYATMMLQWVEVEYEDEDEDSIVLQQLWMDDDMNKELLQ